MRYWAVLGFQAVLAIVILIFALLLIRASNLLGFVVPIVIIGGGGCCSSSSCECSAGCRCRRHRIAEPPRTSSWRARGSGRGRESFG